MVKVKLPPLFLINVAAGDNIIHQLGTPSHSIDAALANYTSTNLKGKIVVPQKTDESQILVVRKKGQSVDSFEKILYVNRDLSDDEHESIDLSDGTWVRHPDLLDDGVKGASQVSKIVESWQGGFSFISEDEERNIKGLREPQIGAIHAIHAHWAVTNETGTIVMPTGTGKTETMISVLVSSQCQRVLIVVPTDALRNQIAEKFISFGVLRDHSVIAPECLYPIVGILKRKPKNVAEVDAFFARCNVIVTTSHIAGQAIESVQERMAFHCSTLFIDEAHHGGAETWKAIKSKFAARQILQFTATPYREDDKPIEGKIIFKYPLSRAQEKGYFTKINFKPVKSLSRKDATRQ